MRVGGATWGDLIAGEEWFGSGFLLSHRGCLCGVCRVLSATYCERLHLHAASQALRVGNCLDCALHVCVNSPPLLWGENHRISLAPLE